jgi:hypothetical protein
MPRGGTAAARSSPRLGVRDNVGLLAQRCSECAVPGYATLDNGFRSGTKNDQMLDHVAPEQHQPALAIQR